MITMIWSFWGVKKEGRKDFCNLPGVAKLIINEQDITVRTCKKVKYTPLKLYENKRSAWRSHLRHHHNVQGDYFWFRYSRLYGVPRWPSKAADHWAKSVWSKVDGIYSKGTHMGGASKKYWLINDWWLIKEQARCWMLKLILHTAMTNFKSIFIVFIDDRITCSRVEELHILNGTGTLDTWSVCNFS